MRVKPALIRATARRFVVRSRWSLTIAKMQSGGKLTLRFVLKGRRNPAWANGLVITHEVGVFEMDLHSEYLRNCWFWVSDAKAKLSGGDGWRMLWL